MATLDLRGWIASLEEIVAAHALDPEGRPGAYRRWRRDDAGGERHLGLDPYGCADAANILYTLRRFPRGEARRGWIATLRGLQEPDTGLFCEATHHPIHTTAHCLGALELFDAGPAHPLGALAELGDPEALARFLDELDWRDDPWLASHRGAGLYAARVLAGEATPAWEERYFRWLRDESDPATGLLRRGCVEPPFRWGETRFPHLAGTFHYLFNMEHARRPLPHPDKLVDTCLEIRADDPFPLGASIGFAEIDWVYCLTRSLSQSGHRFEEGRRALADFAGDYFAYLVALDLEKDDGANDLHRLFGSLCALAELQRVLPGMLRTERPLQLVLDRRPFI